MNSLECMKLCGEIYAACVSWKSFYTRGKIESRDASVFLVHCPDSKPNPQSVDGTTYEVVKASLYRLLDLLAVGVLCGSRHL